MKIPLFILSLLAFGFSVAQQHFFLYIQTENKQPFYVKTNDKLYSSSATGYVVISKLSPDIHVLTIGFNKDAFPEQNFRLIVDKDAGFILKDYGVKGWGLVNLQNNMLVMNGSQKAEPESDEDAFSKTLSQVVNTPDLKNDDKKIDVAPGEKPVIEIKVVEKTVPAVAENTVKPIKILLNEMDGKGRQMVYLDGADTIRLCIENTIKTSTADDVSIKQKNVEEIKIEKSPQVAVENIKTDSKPGIEAKVEMKMINSDCKLLATQEEFLKLRKKMASESSDEEMISVAKKEFKKRCFATDQLRNLSVLFLSDDGKYKFLDASYPFVHDSSNFSSLENILTDIYYKNRFQAMIRR